MFLFMYRCEAWTPIRHRPAQELGSQAEKGTDSQELPPSEVPEGAEETQKTCEAGETKEGQVEVFTLPTADEMVADLEQHLQLDEEPCPKPALVGSEVAVSEKEAGFTGPEVRSTACPKDEEQVVAREDDSPEPPLSPLRRKSIAECCEASKGSKAQDWCQLLLTSFVCVFFRVVSVE